MGNLLTTRCVFVTSLCVSTERFRRFKLECGGCIVGEEIVERVHRFVLETFSCSAEGRRHGTDHLRAGCSGTPDTLVYDKGSDIVKYVDLHTRDRALVSFNLQEHLSPAGSLANGQLYDLISRRID